jgi:hypothetical protein
VSRSELVSEGGREREELKFLATSPILAAYSSYISDLSKVRERGLA